VAVLYQWLDLPRLFTLAVALILLIPAIQPVTDPDFWWHLATGSWILAHHTVPHQDLFTYTVAGHHWIAHEWLSEASLAGLFAVGKLPLVSLALGLVTAAGFLLIYLAIDRRVNFVIAGLALALGVAAANPIWGPRIQMITFCLAALTYLWIKQFCEGHGRALYAMPLVTVLWANLHGGFVVAYIFLGVALVAELIKVVLKRPDAIPLVRLQHLGLIGVASVVAILINPNLWNLYIYAAQTQLSGVQQRFIVEWASPNFHMTEIRFFEAMLFLVVGGLAVARKVELRSFLLFLAGLALALQSVRHLALFVIAAVPVLADLGQQAWERVQGRVRLRPVPANALTFWINSLVLALVALALVGATAPVYGQTVDGKRVARDFPVQAAIFLAKNAPPGHMLNQYGWGGYLVYRLSPTGQKVFIFGDAALAGDALLGDYAHLIYLAPDQPQLLDRYQVNWVIFRDDDPLITELKQARGAWFVLKTTPDHATIMLRDTPQNRSFAAHAGP
jgi:hypothetical protein